jgi:hypothetical protein
MQTYSIIRHFFKKANQTVETGLTLAEAQEHCSADNASSRHCDAETAEANPGVWFDGYTEE